MNYQKAYEELCKAVWEYDKVHNDAYLKLMIAMRDIDGKAGEVQAPIIFAKKPDGVEE